MRISRRSLAPALVATAVALVIAGCGGDDKKGDGKSLKDSNPDNPNFHVAADGSRFGGPAPLTVNFYSESFHEKGPVRWRWRFDDGTTSEERNPSHTFKRPGYYQVLMEARDSHGQDAWNLIVGVWPPEVWEASSKKDVGQLNAKSLRKLQQAQSRRTSKRRAEQLEKSKKRAAQYSSEGRSKL